jgi:hypothetical protein
MIYTVNTPFECCPKAFDVVGVDISIEKIFFDKNEIVVEIVRVIECNYCPLFGRKIR